MPAGSVFVDTNTLAYLHDSGDPAKSAAVTRWLLDLSDLRLAKTNLQVLNELTNVLLRRKWFDSPATVFSIVDTFAALGSASLSFNDVMVARKLQQSLRYSWWDCLLLASAINLGCTHFLSEDLQDGQVIEGLTIVSPFAHSPGQILTSS